MTTAKRLLSFVFCLTLFGAGCFAPRDTRLKQIESDLGLEVPSDVELTEFNAEEEAYFVVGTTSMSPEELAHKWDPEIRALGYDGAMEMRLLPKEVGDSIKTVYIDMDPKSSKKFTMGVRLLEEGAEFMLNRVGGAL